MSIMNAHAPVVLGQGSEKPVRDDRPSASGRPTIGEWLPEVLPLMSAPAFFGPPVIYLLGPWLLLVLLLIPPAAVLITLVLVVVLAAGFLIALGALIASPYLLVRHLRARHQTARGERPVHRPAGEGLIHLTGR